MTYGRDRNKTGRNVFCQVAVKNSRRGFDSVISRVILNGFKKIAAMGIISRIEPLPGGDCSYSQSLPTFTLSLSTSSKINATEGVTPSM